MSNKVKTVKKRRTPKAWLKRYFRVLLGGTIVFMMVLFSLVGPLLSEYDPYKTDMSIAMQGPSEEHWFAWHTADGQPLSLLCRPRS